MSIDELVERAESNWQDANQGHPHDNTWGMFSYGDASGGIGGGVGVFVWFKTYEELLVFLSQTLPFAAPGSGGDWENVSRQTESIAEGMRSGKIQIQDGINKLNAVLAGCSQIEWIGTFDELTKSNETYPSKVRAAFLDCEEETNIEPINSDQISDFKEFLREWGF